MTVVKYGFAMLLMAGVLYACALDGDEAPGTFEVDQVDQEVTAPPVDDLVIGGCDQSDGFCPDENSPGNCRICTGGGGGGGGGGGDGGDPTSGGGSGTPSCLGGHLGLIRQHYCIDSACTEVCTIYEDLAALAHCCRTIPPLYCRDFFVVWPPF